ncbi:unnamed protein product [Moneuplotes crassus]|uniref:Uncharacterized protein n=1 Tax=Euplotes crassus TaxID=5936 RepID=A0AAD1XN11_EUPCR|nr:unnamed protein product [Moneuplotes crassus]
MELIRREELELLEKEYYLDTFCESKHSRDKASKIWKFPKKIKNPNKCSICKFLSLKLPKALISSTSHQRYCRIDLISTNNFSSILYIQQKKTGSIELMSSITENFSILSGSPMVPLKMKFIGIPTTICNFKRMQINQSVFIKIFITLPSAQRLVFLNCSLQPITKFPSLTSTLSRTKLKLLDNRDFEGGSVSSRSFVFRSVLKFVKRGGITSHHLASICITPCTDQERLKDLVQELGLTDIQFASGEKVNSVSILEM